MLNDECFWEGGVRPVGGKANDPVCELGPEQPCFALLAAENYLRSQPRTSVRRREPDVILDQAPPNIGALDVGHRVAALRGGIAGAAVGYVAAALAKC